MRRSPFFLALLSLLFCLSCKQKPQAEYRPTTTIKDLMDGIVDPAADNIWDSVATTMTTKGKEEGASHRRRVGRRSPECPATAGSLEPSSDPRPPRCEP